MNKKIIDFTALEINLTQYSSKKVCAMVKANAYGLGIDKVCRFLEDKVDFFGVCSLEEALQVRKIVRNPILIVNPLQEGEFEVCKEMGFQFIIDDFDALDKVKRLEICSNAHLKINTGMNRFGFSTDRATLYRLKREVQGISFGGISTHFFNLKDRKITKRQYLLFQRVKRILGVDCLVHFGGSGTINYDFQYDMIRVGIGLYLKYFQAMKIYSHIAKISEVKEGSIGYDGKYIVSRPTKIALIPIGYADGLLKVFSGEKVRIQNQECEIIGNICMDCCFVDITDTECKVGDLVEVLPSIKRSARNTGLSEYEVMTNFSNLRLRE